MFYLRCTGDLIVNFQIVEIEHSLPASQFLQSEALIKIIWEYGIHVWLRGILLKIEMAFVFNFSMK